jgi:hypothetical protein
VRKKGAHLVGQAGSAPVGDDDPQEVVAGGARQRFELGERAAQGAQAAA